MEEITLGSSLDYSSGSNGIIFLSRKGKLVESSNTIILCKWEELFGISCLDNSYVVFGEVTLKFRGINKVS
jgi:cyclophilin family peptidyl-prolyl cis-trans isomerase